MFNLIERLKILNIWAEPDLFPVNLPNNMVVQLLIMFNNNEHAHNLNKLAVKHPNPELLTDALAAFEQVTGLTANVDTVQPKDHYADAQIQIAYMKTVWRYAVEIKTRVTDTALGHIAEQARNPKLWGGPPALLVTRYITPTQAKRLRELEVPFIDTAGNAYLNDLPLYVFVTGRKPTRTDKTTPADRLYRTAGLRVLFTLLCRPELVHKPLRAIAEAAGVALGTVTYVLEDLEQQGHLIKRRTRNTRILRDRQTLIERWVTAYAEVLRPRILRGRYQAHKPDWWENADPRQYHAQWGGEVAADLMTHYLKPGTFTIYMDIDTKPGKFLLAHKLERAPKGNIEILDKFWRWPAVDEAKLVPPLLVYADLLAIGDPRTIETARLVNDQWITPLTENA
jgi:hypothetical protein